MTSDLGELRIWIGMNPQPVNHKACISDSPVKLHELTPDPPGLKRWFLRPQYFGDEKSTTPAFRMQSENDPIDEWDGIYRSLTFDGAWCCPVQLPTKQAPVQDGDSGDEKVPNTGGDARMDSEKREQNVKCEKPEPGKC